MKSLVKKRAVSIGGRKTSISLEEAFWTALKGIAQERGETVPRLITGIDAKRKAANRSLVLRVFIIEHALCGSICTTTCNSGSAAR
jgi:predicted DNA-binding ribbon-helix-helix protein